MRFNGVTFGYEPEKTVLRQLSFYAKPGQKIALVGSTGAGKTTITNLLNRFYDVDEGGITYDGIAVKRIRKDDLLRLPDRRFFRRRACSFSTSRSRGSTRFPRDRSRICSRASSAAAGRCF